MSHSSAPGGAGGAGPGGDKVCSPRRAGRPSSSTRQSCAGKAGAGPGAAPRPPCMWRPLRGSSAGNRRGGRSGISPPDTYTSKRGSAGQPPGVGDRGSLPPYPCPQALPRPRGALCDAPRGPRRPRGEQRSGGRRREAPAWGPRGGRATSGREGRPAKPRPHRAHSPLQHQEEGEPCGNLAESGAIQTLEPRCGHSMAGEAAGRGAAGGSSRRYKHGASHTTAILGPRPRSARRALRAAALPSAPSGSLTPPPRRAFRGAGLPSAAPHRPPGFPRCRRRRFPSGRGGAMPHRALRVAGGWRRARRAACRRGEQCPAAAPPSPPADGRRGRRGARRGSGGAAR